jgi:hypothetical protein
LNSISNLECNELTLHSPLELLFAQYKKTVEEVNRIGGLVLDAPQTDYFFDAAKVAGGNYHIGSVPEVFKIEPAIKAVDADFWQKAMLLTDVLEYMPADKRNEWHEQISKHKTPTFEMDSVKQTLIQLLNNRSRFMAERVDGLFRALSPEHITNSPQAFGKRFILNYMLSYSSINGARSNYIHDLRCVIGKFMGRDIPHANATYYDLNSMDRDGKWNEFDGGAFKIRLYKKGTAHMEVHPEIAWQLNKVLAFLHPMAIPAEFRTKPKKAQKSHALHYDLVSYEVIKELESGIPYHSKGATRLCFDHKKPPSAPTISAMERLGGVLEGKATWKFGYLIGPVLTELSRTGRIPEQKSHQFYPTPRNLAEIAVGMAQIEPHHVCLEPSAGLGGLADLMPIDRTTCVEVSELHCAVLKSKGYAVEQADFIKWGYGRTFDRVVLNPPFSAGRAVEHVKHAASMLSIGGVLVAIMPSSNKGKIIVEGMAHEWSEVYDNEFKDASVSVVILKLTK